MAKKFKPGDRVIYTSGKYEESKNNPPWPKYKVVGRVKKYHAEVQVQVAWDNGTYNNYNESDLEHYKGDTMIEKAKTMAEDVHSMIKPFQKYVGFIALAMVIDHFFLGNKFTDRFRGLATALVQRITDSLDKLIDKIKIDDDDAEEVPARPEEDAVADDAAEENVNAAEEVKE